MQILIFGIEHPYDKGIPVCANKVHMITNGQVLRWKYKVYKAKN